MHALLPSSPSCPFDPTPIELLILTIPGAQSFAGRLRSLFHVCILQYRGYWPTSWTLQYTHTHRHLFGFIERELTTIHALIWYCHWNVGIFIPAAGPSIFFFSGHLNDRQLTDIQKYWCSFSRKVSTLEYDCSGSLSILQNANARSLNSVVELSTWHLHNLSKLESWAGYLIPSDH